MKSKRRERRRRRRRRIRGRQKSLASGAECDHRLADNSRKSTLQYIT
jgi:hypothetical protein